MNIFLKKRKGSALATAVIVFLIVSIFGAIVLSVSNQNLLESKHQESSTEAYYLAYSGIQMAFSALIEDSNDLMDEVVGGAVFTQNDIDFGNGTVDVTVSLVNGSPVAYDGWVAISATGTLDSGNFSRSRVLYIDPQNQKNTAWRED